MRLDKFLLENGFFTSREKAQAAIKHKTVKVDGAVCTKASTDITQDNSVEVIDIFNRYVSMGGLKLEKAIEDFSIDFAGKSVLDIGASTGGFTDCAIHHGAASVVAVDVGTAQLAPALLNDKRVISLENRDFRTLTLEDLGTKEFDIVVSDVSFISLTYIIPNLVNFLSEESLAVLLIKPQFEAGQSFLNRSGIVTEEKGQKLAIQRVVGEALNHKLFLHGISVSTLFEKHKNVEFLAIFSKKNSNFSPNYTELFNEVKKLKKSLS